LTNKSSSGTKTQIKEADQETGLLLDVLSCIAQAPVFYTAGDPEASDKNGKKFLTDGDIETHVTWADSDLGSKSYDRNFMNVIVSMMATRKSGEAFYFPHKKQGLVYDFKTGKPVEEKTASGIIVDGESPEVRTIKFAGGNFVTIPDFAGDPLAKMAPAKKSHSISYAFFNFQKETPLWVNVHELNKKQTLGIHKFEPAEGLYVAGIEICDPVNEKARTHLHYIAHVENVFDHEALEKYLLLTNAKTTTEQARNVAGLEDLPQV